MWSGRSLQHPEQRAGTAEHCDTVEFEPMSAFREQTGHRREVLSPKDLGCAKTLRGITAPRIFWALRSSGEQKPQKFRPLGIATRSDFVFTRPRPKRSMPSRT